MNGERPLSGRNPWMAGAVGVTAGLAVAFFLVGFLILPYTEAGANFAGIWDAICSAAGDWTSHAEWHCSNRSDSKRRAISIEIAENCA